ncbi:type II CRISPR-associated endonuclease Cas1 [Oenococcus alcoholitolerans]|uniref:CRISPR-associated endonuclease Cas1 n=1 Tax=Oenococcus alcoholitolerans TaxID=931074 RepID=A0ABR4XQZ8_9LACO|nr:hypothetical protein Q757_04290 [Oenococcus alcoholitolerans]
MAWRNILINQHCKISYKLNMCIVQTDTDVRQIPVEDIRVLIIGTTRAVITAYAVMELLRRQVRVLFTDDKSFPIGEINNYIGNGNRNQNIQKQISWRTERKHLLWKKIVQTKITNQAACLKGFQKDDQSLLDLIPEIMDNDSSNREAVAARLYFTRLFGKDFVRHDDDQKINFLLNYGYSILLSTVSREISANGYLTEIGIHHDSQENQYNLACDLMEVFRPAIDRAVFQMKEYELTLENKITLIEIFDQEISYLGQSNTINSAITLFVRKSLNFLSGIDDQMEADVEI